MKTQVLEFSSKTMLMGLVFLFFLLQSTLTFSQQKDVKAILEGYAKDYETDVTFNKDIIFAVKVDDSFWHIIAKAKTEESPAKVSVQEGKPEVPTFYFFTDIETLNKIDKGELNPLTGAAKAFSSEFAPFDADVMEGFNPDQDFLKTLLSVYFHFWTKGLPERIPFGLDYTRFTHGAQASIFYYQPGFRSGYVAIKKGQHANKDEKSKTNPFPTILIAIKGEGKMIINGTESILTAGEAVLIPAGITHEFMNKNDDPLECILLMFGEGA
jgi:quercetin dioxygenase-like cupin family protein